MDIQYVKTQRGIEEISALFHQARKWGAWIAGGFAAWAAAPDGAEPPAPTDIDIFTSSWRGFNEIGFYLNKYGYHREIETPTAHTYMKQDSKAVQIIVPRDYVTHADVIVDFDFSVCQAVFVSPSKIGIGEYFMEDIGAKRLRIMTVKEPILAIRRIAKYSQKGYAIKPEDVIKIFGRRDDMGAIERQNMIAQYAPDEGWDAGETFISDFYMSYDADDEYDDKPDGYAWRDYGYHD